MKVMMTDDPPKGQGAGKPAPLIGITGPCGAGQTTLQAELLSRGYRARAIVQEHSYVKDMWQRITKPDILIFLQASCAAGAKRRRMSWTESEWEEQQHRLAHARSHADLVVETDSLGSAEVLNVVLEFLGRKQIDPQRMPGVK